MPCLDEVRKDPGQVILNSEVIMASLADGTLALGANCQMGVQDELGGSAEVVKDSVDKVHLLQKVGPEVGKKNIKASSQLGVLQKVLKKGGPEKISKLGRKKDEEKIKMIGETLVESGSVKTLDSHFSCPSK